jgi:hypothetical protein
MTILNAVYPTLISSVTVHVILTHLIILPLADGTVETAASRPVTQTLHLDAKPKKVTNLGSMGKYFRDSHEVFESTVFHLYDVFVLVLFSTAHLDSTASIRPKT